MRSAKEHRETAVTSKEAEVVAEDEVEEEVAEAAAEIPTSKGRKMPLWQPSSMKESSL